MSYLDHDLEDDRELCRQEAAELRWKLARIRVVAQESEPSHLRGYVLGIIRPQEVDDAA